LGAVLLLAAVVLVGITGPATKDASEKKAEYLWTETGRNPLHAQCIDRGDAIRLARAALLREHTNVTGWVCSAVVDNGGFSRAGKNYLQKYLSDKDLAALEARLPLSILIWTVRWQKPLVDEYWEVRLTADGRVWDVERHVPEEAPGAQLTEAQAMAIARDALTRQGFPPSRWRLAGAKMEKLPHRLRYVFRWQLAGLQVGEAKILTNVAVDGDRVNWIITEVQVPDSYTFDKQKKNESTRSTICMAVTLLLLVLLGIWGGGVAIATLRRYRMLWRWGYWAGACGALIVLAIRFAGLPRAWTDLSSLVSPSAFLLRYWLGGVGGAITFGMLLLIAVPITIALWSSGFPSLPGPRTWLSALARPLRHLAAWRTALLAQFLLVSILAPVLGLEWLLDTKVLPDAGASAGFHAASVQIPRWLQLSPALLHASPPVSSILSFAQIDGRHPIIEVLLIALAAGGLILLAWLVLVGMAARMFRKTWYALLCACVLCIPAMIATSDSWMEAGKDIAGLLVALVGVWVLYRLVLRAQPLALPVAVTTALLAAGISVLLWFPAYRTGAVLLGVLVIAAYVWAIISQALMLSRAGRARRQTVLPPAAPVPEE
jgi:hypothetical protein